MNPVATAFRLMEINKEVSESAYVEKLGSQLLYNRQTMSDNEFIKTLNDLLGGAISLTSALTAGEFLSELEVEQMVEGMLELNKMERDIEGS